MSCFDSISPSDLVIIATLLSLLISDDKDSGELNVSGNLIVAVGSLVLTVAAQKEFLKNQQEKDSNEDIKKQIKCLQEKCDKLSKD